MSTMLKCPNPSCTFVFDASTVPQGVVLACPRCAMQFTLGNPAQQTPQTSAASPGANPFGTTTPPSPAPARNAPPTKANSSGVVYSKTEVADPSTGRKSRLQSFILAGVSAVAIAACAIALWYKLTHNGESVAADSAYMFKEHNLSFEPPPSPWVRDEETRASLGSPYMLVYKRDNPEAHMAFGARDYDPRSPRESELQRGLMQALENLIDKNHFSLIDEKMDSSWMGQDVKGFRFRTQLKSGQAVEGEGYRLVYKGIGYWFLGWTGDNLYEEMHHDFAEARRHCKLLDLRNDWKERQSATIPFKGDRVGYTILDCEGIWEEEKDEGNIKFEGDEADKLLKLKKGKNKDVVQDGNLIVYVLPDGGDPMTVAREFVTKHRKDEIKRTGDYPVDFSEVTSMEGDQLPSPVEHPASVLRLQSKVKGAKDQNRFHVISGAKIDNKIVVVHAYCDLSRENRELLEPIFVQIASSLHGG